MADVPQRLPAGRFALHLPPGLPPRDVADPLGRWARELRRVAVLLPVPLGAGRWQRRRHARCRPRVRRRRRRSPDQVDLRGAGRQHGGRPERDRRVQRPDRLRTCARPTDLFKDWAIAIYLDDPDSDLFDIKNVDFGTRTRATGRSSSPTTCSSAAAASTRAPLPNAFFLHNKDVPQQTALPFGTSYETFRNPGPTFKLNLDGADDSQVAPHSGDTHWYANYKSLTDNILNVDSAVAGGDTLDFWTWYFIEEGWDYGFVEALVGGDWVTVPLVDDNGTDGHDQRQPARQQHRGQRPDRYVRRRLLRRRPRVHPPQRGRFPPARPTSASATRPTRRTSIPAGSWTTSRSTVRPRR